MTVGGHDPRRDLKGTGVFGLTGCPRVDGMIHSGAVIAVREPVVTVGPQRHPIGAGCPGPTRVGDLLGRRQPFGGAASRPRSLAHRGTVLLGVGVAARTIQRPLPGPRPVSGPCRGDLLLVGAGDLVDDQLLGMVVGKRGNCQVGCVGIDPGAPLGGDLGATRPGNRGLIPALMYE